MCVCPHHQGIRALSRHVPFPDRAAYTYVVRGQVRGDSHLEKIRAQEQRVTCHASPGNLLKKALGANEEDGEHGACHVPLGEGVLAFPQDVEPGALDVLRRKQLQLGALA